MVSVFLYIFCNFLIFFFICLSAVVFFYNKRSSSVAKLNKQTLKQMKNALSSVRSRKKITRLFPRRTLPDVLFLFSHHTLITFVVFRSFAHSSPEKHPPWRCRCNLSLRRYLLDVALPGISLISFSKTLHNSTLNTASHNVATAVIANLGSCYRLFLSYCYFIVRCYISVSL